MSQETNFHHVVTAMHDDDARLDQSVKEALADKQFLSRILKATMPEFADLEPDEVTQCILGEVEVGNTLVNPGYSNLPAEEQAAIIRAANSVSHSATDGDGVSHSGATDLTLDSDIFLQPAVTDATTDSIPNEGFIVYDLRFRVKTPQDEIIILLNLEGQAVSQPEALKYHIENRILFYISRMISSQKTLDFVKSNYDDIHPVRSIWILMDCPTDYIAKYSFMPTTVFGTPDREFLTGMAEAIIIGIRARQKVDRSENRMIQMLEDFFLKEDSTSKKRRMMQHGIKMMIDTKGEVNNVCNYSVLVRREGREEGLKEGRAEGLATGAIIAKISFVDNLMAKLKSSLEEACSLAEISVEEYNAHKTLVTTT